jgi:hypothetical protein
MRLHLRSRGANMRIRPSLLAPLLLVAPLSPASSATGQLANTLLQLRFEIPSAAGSYDGTRFDWSGMIRSLRVQGHEVYGPWFDRIDAATHNNVQRVLPDGTGQVITGIASSGQGPSEEFLTEDKALGFDAAPPGGLFLKLGVGVLRRPDGQAYDRYRAYEIVDRGRWTTRVGKRSVMFRQILSNRATGYGYVYTKTLQIGHDRPVLVMHHRLQNTGTKALDTSVYDHNFFATGRPTDAAYKFVAPWSITAEALERPDLIRVADKSLQFSRTFNPTDMTAVWLKGFNGLPNNYAFRVEDGDTGIGYSVQADRPLDRVMLWAIWTNVSIESFIRLNARPGQEERWTYTYTYTAPR